MPSYSDRHPRPVRVVSAARPASASRKQGRRASERTLKSSHLGLHGEGGMKWDLCRPNLPRNPSKMVDVIPLLSSLSHCVPKREKDELCFEACSKAYGARRGTLPGPRTYGMDLSGRYESSKPILRAVWTCHPTFGRDAASTRVVT